MFTPIIASIDNLTLGYIVTDNNQHVEVINRSARQLLAATKTIDNLEQIIEQLPSSLEIMDHIKFCSPEGKSCAFHEIDLGGKLVRVSLSPIFDGMDLRGNVLTLEDVTERRDQEHAREQFLSLLVHELRTPLTAIRGNSSIIQDYYKDALKDTELHQMIDDIGSGSRHLLEIVNQFLDMSRLEEGRIEFDLKQFNVLETIGEAARTLNVLAKERGLSLEFEEPQEKEIQVVADPGRVTQVLTNLIGNALKFTEKGGVTVSVAQKDNLLEVSVTDTGSGIPADSQQGLFKKYFQASNNKLRGDSAKSTGLGLYVTKLTVEGMGGTIYLAKTEPDKGSTFAFTLTMATPERLKLLTKQLYDAKHGVTHAAGAAVSGH